MPQVESLPALCDFSGIAPSLDTSLKTVFSKRVVRGVYLSIHTGLNHFLVHLITDTVCTNLGDTRLIYKAGISLCIVFHTTSSSAKKHFRRVGPSPHRSTFCNNTIHYSHCFLFHICFLISSPFPPAQQQHGCTTVRPICPPSDLTHTLILQQVTTSTATPGPNAKYISLQLFPQTLIRPSPVLKKLLKFIMREMIVQD